MNRSTCLALLLGLSLGSTQAADPHAGHHQGAAMTTARTQAEVRSIDHQNHQLSVAHGAIPELKWPPMVMDFSATPAQLQGLAVGDQVELKIGVEAGEVHLLDVRRSQDE